MNQVELSRIFPIVRNMKFRPFLDVFPNGHLHTYLAVVNVGLGKEKAIDPWGCYKDKLGLSEDCVPSALGLEQGRLLTLTTAMS